MQPKILIVDDDASVRQTVRCVLGSIGEVLEAARGAEALTVISEQRPRMILLDVSMPEMGGLAVLQAARAIDPSATVVMLTAQSDIAVAKKALGLGARAYVTKPFNAESLCEQVRDLMGIFEAGKGPTPYRPWRVAC